MDIFLVGGAVRDKLLGLTASERDWVVVGGTPEALEKQGFVLSPRGERFTRENIGARLTMRDFLDSMRSSGVDTGGPAAFSQSDRKAFADQLDKLLSKNIKHK